MRLQALLLGEPGVAGHALAAEWLGRGHALRALCPADDGPGLAGLSGSPGFLGVTRARPGDPAALKTALRERHDVCFCMPGCPAPGDSGASSRAAVVEWMGELVEVAEACRARGTRLVYVGSAAALEPYRGRDRQHEGWPTAPRTPWAAALLAGEQLVMSYDRSYGLPVTVCRAFNVYGPVPPGVREPGVVAAFALKAARGERLPVHGDGHQSRDFLHADDLARLLAELGAHERLHGRVVHAASGEETRIVDLARLMSAGTGYEFVTHPAPLAEGGRMRGDATLARKLVKWSPAVTLREGLRGMRSWAAASAAGERPAEPPLEAAS